MDCSQELVRASPGAEALGVGSGLRGAYSGGGRRWEWVVALALWS